MPVSVKEDTDTGTSEDHPNSILHGAHGVVLHCLVLPVQPDGDLGDAILVDDLPDVPVFFPRCFPEPKGGDEGIFIRETLGKHIFSPLHHREGSHPHIGTLGSIVSLSQDLLHTEQIHQVKTCDLLGFSVGVLKPISFYTDTWAEHILAQSAPQLATNLVNRVEVGHMEDVGGLGLRSDLLQFLLQGCAHAHRKDTDARCMSGHGGVQHQVLAATVGQQDGHLLEGTVARPAASLRGEAAARDVAQGVASVGVAALVRDASRSHLHLLARAEAAQLEGRGGGVAVAHNAHARTVWAHLERVHQVGHPLPHLLEVLLAHAGGGVQEENQVVVHAFAACPLGLAAAIPTPQQQYPEEAGHSTPSGAHHGSLVLGHWPGRDPTGV